MLEDTKDAKLISKLKEEDAVTDSGHATESEEDQDDEKIIVEEPYTRQIVWPNIIKFIILHCLALYGITILPSLLWQSWLFLMVTYQ